MAQRINLRGVIVPSGYDTEWAQDYINKGMLTPESVFRRNLAAVTDDDVEIYINSPGGSVFAAYEMVNAAIQWRADTGRELSVTVGALAASAAAMFAVMVGGRFQVHANSKIMFHGATSEVWGGSQAMADESELLDKINSDVRTALVARYNLSPETVAEWFEEGRMGWLNAVEAQAAGMVSEVVEAADPPIEFDRAALAGGKLDNVAAWLQSAVITEPEEHEAHDGRHNPGAPGANDQTAKSNATAGTGDDPAPSATDVAWDEGNRAGVTAEAALREAALEEQRDRLTAAHAEVERVLQEELDRCKDVTIEREATLTAERDTALRDATTAQGAAKDLSARLARLLGGTAAPPMDTLDASPMGWAEVMKQAKSDGMDYNAAHAHCVATYPDLHAAYLKSKQKTQG